MSENCANKRDRYISSIETILIFSDISRVSRRKYITIMIDPDLRSTPLRQRNISAKGLVVTALNETVTSDIENKDESSIMGM